MSKSWRECAAPIIAKVLQNTAGLSEEVIKKALFDAYPFGERKYHPYKIWLDEIRIQLGKRKFGQKKEKADPNQKDLFV